MEEPTFFFSPTRFTPVGCSGVCVIAASLQLALPFRQPVNPEAGMALDTFHLRVLRPTQKNRRRGNVFCRGQTFPRRPVFWIFRRTNVVPDVETFHEHPHGKTFPRRAVSPRTFPRRAIPLDVETFLIGAKRHARKSCRRGNVFPDIANVSTSP